MLFTIEKLGSLGYPQQALAPEAIAEALASTHENLRRQYDEKRLAILEKLDALKALVDDPKNWWNQSPAHAEAVHNFQVFIGNIAHNFGDPAYGKIHAPANEAKRHAEIIEAISRYAEDRKAWAEVLARHGKPA